MRNLEFLKVEGLGCLMIDLQDCFLKAIPERDALVNRASFVLETCQLLDIPVFFSEQVPEKLGPTLPELTEKTCDPFIFGKTEFSAWQNGPFQDQLREKNISHLLVGGIETTICVYQTIIAARGDEVAVTLLSDAIGCRRPEDVPPVIDTLQEHNTLYLPSETIFYSILQNVSHPAFRAFTQLVKKYNS